MPGAFITNFEHILHFILLYLNKQMPVESEKL